MATFVISSRLSTGQVTFIFRAVVQVISYGGIFLLGLIILGHSPRVAPVETHDVLNRVVGKSTAMVHTIKWIKKRILRKNRDPAPSSLLLVALLLSLLFGLFVAISDIGFLGLQACTVSGNSQTTGPASISSEEDAHALVAANMLNGTLPESVKSHRCDSAQDVVISVNVTERICDQWHNSTYGDPSAFRILNTTDSEVLMNRYLAQVNHTRQDVFDLDVFLLGATGSTVREATIQGGLAVIPHGTGVHMIVGVPKLSPNQRATMPKTMALEVDIGCLPLGTNSYRDTSDTFTRGYDYFLPDDAYKSSRASKYTGPEYLMEPLEKAADAIRDFMRPLYNTSDIISTGFMRSFNESTGLFSWQTTVNAFYPPTLNNQSLSDISDTVSYVLGNCTALVHQALQVETPSKPVQGVPLACALYSLQGSFFEVETAFQGHSEMVCATATAINMVSATLEVGAEGNITSQLTRLPSDLDIVRASYFDVRQDIPNPGDITWVQYGALQRFTLSDNPAGSQQHFIYQQKNTFGATPTSLQQGVASPGQVLSQVGGIMVGVSSLDDSSLSMIDPNYFSANNFSTGVVTSWAGGVGASMLLANLGYNGYAALDKSSIVVESTGGKSAVCYKGTYGIAFLPLFAAAVIILLWTLQMAISFKLRGTKKLGKMYGGMAPIIVAPNPTKPASDAILSWENVDDQPHLRPAYIGMPLPYHHGLPVTPGTETEMLVSPMKTEYVS